MATCLPHAKRKFYDFPEKVAQNSTSVCDSTDELIKYIEGNIIGKEKVFSSPYGLRKVVYCDYTASGQSLGFIEDYIREQVLTNYGNTHTTTTVTSLQTSLYRHEARDIIRNAVNASEHDAVIFAGSGCTATVHKLIHAMHLKMSPVVFVGPYEHHSNLLPWRELGAQVVRISQTPDGLIDMLHLETELMKWKSSNKQLIGCFSAASNVTGILSDVNAISSMLHQYGALAFWDYATAGPHVQINMHPVSEVAGDMSKDAVFISTHKFVGGVQTPGVLVAKKSLFKNPVPSNCGGGSVFYVRRNGHRYLQEVEMREEGGTPAIVESVRAGLVFQLKEAVSSQVIMQREDRLCRQALQAWSGCSNLILLGNTTTPRLPVFSFLVRHGANGLFLHHNFVSSLLNDMFGIQTRGGCACAGPYAQDLLGIDEELSEQIETILAEDSRLDRTHLRRYREYSETEILRPGFVRLNLPFFMSDETADFVLTAVKLVAEHGWKMLPQYIFNPETGEWRHRHHQVFKDRKWLGSISYASGHMTFPEPQAPMKGPLPQSLKECLEMAVAVFNEASKVRVQLADQTLLFDSSAQSIRWFLLPSEARDYLQNPADSAPVKHQPPFTPPDLFVGKGRVYESRVTGVTISSKSADSEMDAEKCNKYITVNQHDQQSDNICQQPDEPVSVMSSGAAIGSEENKSKSTVHSSREADALPNAHAELSVSPQIAASCIANGSADGQHQTCNSSAHQDLSGNQSEGLSNSALEQVQDYSYCLSSDVHSGMISRHSEYTNAVEEVNVLSVPNKGGGKLNRVRRTKWCSPPKKIFKPTVEALEEYSMIHNGDRVLVCLSGGKDSLSLLHCLKQYQFYCKSKGIEFKLGAVTVDPQTSSYDPSPLKQYTASLSVPYFYEEQCILDTASNLPDGCASICSFCSRMKRGRIYACARREGYNVLAMGQHLDDLTESFLMSVFHNGALRTMKANYTVEEGDLRVIRPFVYVREKDLRSFAEQNCLPVIAENCPACFEAPKERHRTKQLLAAQEVLFPNLYSSLMAAMKPLMAVDRTGVDLRKMLGGRGDAMNEVDL